MSEFSWRKVSEQERVEIKKQAEKIMEGFAKKISGVGVSKLGEPVVERESSQREETGEGCLPIDREIFLENAPEKNSDFILGEKKSWEGGK